MKRMDDPNPVHPAILSLSGVAVASLRMIRFVSLALDESYGGAAGPPYQGRQGGVAAPPWICVRSASVSDRTTRSNDRALLLERNKIQPEKLETESGLEQLPYLLLPLEADCPDAILE